MTMRCIEQNKCSMKFLGSTASLQHAFGRSASLHQTTRSLYRRPTIICWFMPKIRKCGNEALYQERKSSWPYTQIPTVIREGFGLLTTTFQISPRMSDQTAGFRLSDLLMEKRFGLRLRQYGDTLERSM